MDEKTVSVIIPVYNAEKYLAECLESVQNQTYHPLQIILIEDGSSDQSGKICDEYAAEDERIEVYHQPNSGVSAARNKGLMSARGGWIAFIDADDRVAPDYIERLIGEAEKSGADIVCCDLIERVGSFDGEIVTDRIHAVRTPRTIDRAEQFYHDYFDKEEYYGYAVWGKIIKRELAGSESFSSLKYGEDLQYMMNLFFHSPKCVLTNYRGYEYIRWSDSATVSAGNLSIKVSTGEVAAAKTLYDHCVKLGDEKLLARAESNYAACVYSLLSVYIRLKDWGAYHHDRKLLKEFAETALKMKHISSKHKMLLRLYAFSGELYRMIITLIIGGKYA